MREVMIGCDIVIETDFFDEVLHHFGVDLQGFVVSLVIQDLEADLTELLVGVEMVLEVWIRDFGDVCRITGQKYLSLRFPDRVYLRQPR